MPQTNIYRLYIHSKKVPSINSYLVQGRSHRCLLSRYRVDTRLAKMLLLGAIVISFCSAPYIVWNDQERLLHNNWLFISCVTSYSVSVAKMRCRRCRTSTHSVLTNNFGSTTDDTRRRRKILITFWLHEKIHKSYDVSSASKTDEYFRSQAEAALLLRRFEDTSIVIFLKVAAFRL